jgi:hypothetical protein
MLGEIGYLAQTCRPDLKLAHSMLSRKSAAATESYVKGVIHVISYVKNTIENTLRFGTRDKNIRIFAYTDASFDMRNYPQGGTCIFLGLDSAAIYNKSNRIKQACLSSHDPETKQAADTVVEMIYTKDKYEENGLYIPRTERKEDEKNSFFLFLRAEFRT